MKISVLLLIFNRPNQTRQVMNVLEVVQPDRLYIAADGPRYGHEFDVERCEEARRIAASVKWPCQVYTLFRDSNLGCKRAVSSAIDWFFDCEKEGIILEDDCLPHFDFFRFCAYGLNLYRSDERLFAITGDNFQNGLCRGESGASYYFSKYPHCWGWATWRRAWKAYDGDLTFWDNWLRTASWRSLHSNPIERLHWERLALEVRNESLDSWATPWMFSVWFHHGLTMTPNVNLVTNIGFGDDATHTISRRDSSAGLPVHPIRDFYETPSVLVDLEADSYVFHHHFGGRNLIFPRSLIIAVKKLLSQIRRSIIGNTMK